MSKQSNVDVVDKLTGLNKLLKPVKISKSKEVCANKIINKGGRPSKASQFDKERKKVLDDMYTILKLSDTQKFVYLYDLDNDLEMQNKIMALKDHAKIYFNSGTWAIFSKDDVKRPYMSLIRSIIKDMKIKTITVQSSIERNGEKHNTCGFMLL